MRLCYNVCNAFDDATAFKINKNNNDTINAHNETISTGTIK